MTVLNNLNKQNIIIYQKTDLIFRELIKVNDPNLDASKNETILRQVIMGAILTGLKLADSDQFMKEV